MKLKTVNQSRVTSFVGKLSINQLFNQVLCLRLLPYQLHIVFLLKFNVFFRDKIVIKYILDIYLRVLIICIILSNIQKRYKSAFFEIGVHIYFYFKYSSPFHESTTCLQTNSFCSQKYSGHKNRNKENKNAFTFLYVLNVLLRYGACTQLLCLLNDKSSERFIKLVNLLVIVLSSKVK